MIKNTPNMKPAFSMITAIFLIVLMSSVAAFVMNLSGKMIQETVTNYQKEQATLYAKSYTEFAIMAATSQNCIQDITDDIGANPLTGDGYTILVNTQYIGSDLVGPKCNTVGATPITTATSKGGTIILDTYVRYKNPNAPNVAISPWITYHRRTLQRL